MYFSFLSHDSPSVVWGTLTISPWVFSFLDPTITVLLAGVWTLAYHILHYTNPFNLILLQFINVPFKVWGLHLHMISRCLAQALSRTKLFLPSWNYACMKAAQGQVSFSNMMCSIMHSVQSKPWSSAHISADASVSYLVFGQLSFFWAPNRFFTSIFVTFHLWPIISECLDIAGPWFHHWCIHYQFTCCGNVISGQCWPGQD